MKDRLVMTLDPDLTSFDRDVYSVLRAAARNSNRLKATHKWLCHTLGRAETSIRDSMRRLRTRGLLSKDGENIVLTPIREIYGWKIDAVAVPTEDGFIFKKKSKKSNNKNTQKGVVSATGGVGNTTGGVSEIRHPSDHKGVGITTPFSGPVIPSEVVVEEELTNAPRVRVVQDNPTGYLDSPSESRCTFPTEKSDAGASVVPPKERSSSLTKRAAGCGLSFEIRRKNPSPQTPAPPSPPKSRTGGFESFTTAPEKKSARKRRAKAAEGVKDTGGLPTTAPEVYQLFREKMLARHPDARLPAMATPKDLKRVKVDVMGYSPEDVSKMIDVLVIDWARLKKTTFPTAPDQLLPTFDYLWRYVNRLAVALSEGVGGTGQDRGGYNPKTGEGDMGWIFEKWERELEG